MPTLKKLVENARVLVDQGTPLKPHAITSQQRRAINAAFSTKGLGGRVRYEKPAHGYADATHILGDFGIELQQPAHGMVFNPEDGTASFDLLWSNPDDPYSPQELTNSMLVVGWHRHMTGHGTYEVTAYMS